MADGIAETVRELLDEGYSKEEIRQALRQEGYNPTVVDRALEDAMYRRNEQPSSGLWRIQQYSWLAAFLVVLAGYSAVALWPLKMRSVPQIAIYGVVGAVGIIFGIHLIAGLYWAVKRHTKRAAVSLGGVILTAGGFAVASFLLLQAFRRVSSQLTPFSVVGRDMVTAGMAPWLLNISVLFMAAIAVVYLYGRFGRIVIGAPLLFLVIFAGIWGVQYMQLTGAADALAAPSFQTVVMEDQEGASHLIRGAAHVPPPFTKAAAVMGMVADVGAQFAWWSGMYQEGQSLGYGDRPLTGPEEVCGGTSTIIRERYNDPVHTVLASYKSFVIARMEQQKTALIVGMEDYCASLEGCTAGRPALRNDADTYIKWQKTRLETYRDLFGVSLEDAPQLVDDCSPPPKQYHGVKLQDISCSDDVTAELSYIGTKPLTSSVQFYVYDRNRDLAFARNPGEVTNWSSGMKTLSANADSDGFEPGEPYRVDIDFEDTDLHASAYCVGGNGFCRNCRIEQRPSKYGGNKTVLVR